MNYERERSQERCVPILMVEKWIPYESGLLEKCEG